MKMEHALQVELRPKLRRVMMQLELQDEVDEELIENAMEILEKMKPPPPPEFICPISRRLMRGPSIASSGQTFETAYIRKYMEVDNPNCPITGQPFSHKTLTPNFLLNQMIRMWHVKRQIQLPVYTYLGYEYIDVSATMKEFDEFSLSRDFLTSIIRLDWGCLSSFSCSGKSEKSLSVSRISGISSQTLHRVFHVCWLPFSVPMGITQMEPSINIAVILNVSTNLFSHWRLIKENPIVIPFLTRALSEENDETKSLSAAALCELSKTYGYEIGKSEVYRPLIEMIKQGNPIASREAAATLSRLCDDDENRERALKESVLIAAVEKLDDPLLFDAMIDLLAKFSSHGPALKMMRELRLEEKVFALSEDTSCPYIGRSCDMILHGML